MIKMKAKETKIIKNYTMGGAVEIPDVREEELACEFCGSIWGQLKTHKVDGMTTEFHYCPICGKELWDK